MQVSAGGAGPLPSGALARVPCITARTLQLELDVQCETHKSVKGSAGVSCFQRERASPLGPSPTSCSAGSYGLFHEPREGTVKTSCVSERTRPSEGRPVYLGRTARTREAVLQKPLPCQAFFTHPTNLYGARTTCQTLSGS